MPFEVDQRAFFHLSLLLLILPIQYYLVKQSPSSEEKKLEGLRTIWTFGQETYSKLFSLWPLKVFLKELSKLISLLQRSYADNSGESIVENPTLEEDESPAVEVLKRKYAWGKSGHFASSLEPRYPRPSHIKFRIGQIVKHRKWGYRGVVVGWDSLAKAPSTWIKENHNQNEHWSTQPNYAILVDIRDRTIPQLAYVPEENIELAPALVRITHPGMEDYFEDFDGAQYLPRPWLKTLYPMDA